MNKKIMVIGNYKWDFYEKALCEGFVHNGFDVIQYTVPSLGLLKKILNYKKLLTINKKFIREVIDKQPSVLFFYRTNEIFSKSLQTIKQEIPTIKIILYHNDNPYIGLKNRLKYYLFLKLIKISDITYVYRPSNLTDAKKFGAKNTKLLYPYYYSKRDLVKKIDFSKKIYDVIFIGHYEKNRSHLINYLIKNNIQVKIFSSCSKWMKDAKKYKWPEGTVNNSVFGQMYRDTLSKSKLALCFLSKINKDVYTRRNFEIPASGTLTVSEYTEELTNLFKNNEEIILFKNKEDLYAKISTILRVPEKLKVMTIASHKRIISGNHSEKDRAKQIINDLGWIK